MCSTRNVVISIYVCSILPLSSLADDIDIFKNAGNQNTADNILLLLDNSNSMRWGMLEDSIMLEDKYYDKNTIYEGSSNAMGGIGDPDYVYFYRWIDHYFAAFDYVNKVPRSALTTDCADQNNSLSPSQYDDDDILGENPFSGIGTYSNLLQNVYQINLSDGSSAAVGCTNQAGTYSSATVNGTTVTCGEGENNTYTPNQGDQYVFKNGNTWDTICDFTDDEDDCPLNKESANTIQMECQNKPLETSDFHYEGNESLFMFDHNQHNFLQQYYRFSIMKTSVKNMIDEIFNRSANVNVALTAFRGNPGGSYVVNSFTNTNPNLLDSTGHDALRKELKRRVDALPIDSVGGTPIAESLWEAKTYFRGEIPKFSDSSSNDVGSMKNSAFISPIQTSCQNSHIILLSDGEPSTDLDSNADISQLALPMGTQFSNPSGTYQCLSTEPGGDDNCGEELAEWLYLTDHKPDIDGNQNVHIHTVALTRKSQSLDKLQNLASTNGDAYEAENSEELTEKLTKIMNTSMSNVDTMATPALSVSAYNALQHRNQLYFALFEPNGSNRWRGNVKRYQINSDGIITDVNGQTVVAESGGFKENAQSWWTGDLDGDGNTDADGDKVSIGGFATAKVAGKATLLQPNARKLYTWWGGSKLLSSEENRFPSDNNNDGINASEFASDSEEKFRSAMASSPFFDSEKFYDAMLWVRGGNNTNPHGWAPDVIHNSPVLINYFNDGIHFDDTLFAGSNLGFLHAIDPNDGAELYGFMPSDLLGNGYSYFAQQGSASDKNYGLDAPMTIWRNDINNDGNIVIESGSNQAQAGEFIYLYQSMRRGGKNIYALDVTQRSTPKMLWQINGGLGDFLEMGQSWSAPQLTKIPWCPKDQKCFNRDILVFGGGYDLAYDENIDGAQATHSSDWKADQGNAIYIVDAKTGTKLWSMGYSGANTAHNLAHQQMRYSVVANVTPVDINNDGVMDILYAVDIRGNLWRLDFKSIYSSPSEMVSAGIVAQLSSSENTNKRRFFNAPDVALFSKRGTGKQVVAISVASGHRSRPNDTEVQDRIAVIMDRSPFKKPESYLFVKNKFSIQFNNLVNLESLSTNNSNLPNTFTDIIEQNDNEFYGLYLNLNGKGEKAISPSIIYGGELIVTSFIPFDSSSLTKEEACLAQWGDGKLYKINLNPFFEDQSNIETKLLSTSKSNLINESALHHRGIPPMPQVYITPCKKNCTQEELNKPKTTLCVGLECKQNTLPQTPIWYKTYWREKSEHN